MASPLQAPFQTGEISSIEISEPFSRPTLETKEGDGGPPMKPRRAYSNTERYDLGSAPTEDVFTAMNTHHDTISSREGHPSSGPTISVALSPLPTATTFTAAFTGSQKRIPSTTLSSMSGGTDFRPSGLELPDDFKGESSISPSPKATPVVTFIRAFPNASTPTLGDRGSSNLPGAATQPGASSKAPDERFSRSSMTPSPLISPARSSTVPSLSVPSLPSINFDPKGVDFDYDCFRSDDGKSDEEFLDPKFWKELQITRQQNRTRLTKRKTRTGLTLSNGPSAQDVAVQAEEGVKQMVLERRLELPELSGYLEKQSPSLHARWQKRWVVVVDHTLFYWKEKVAVGSAAEAEKTGHLNKISLFLIDKIVKDDRAKKGQKFEIVARDPRSGERRHYKWRCENGELCNQWVDGLRAHKEQAMAELKMGVNSHR